jgi:hypothetical protein
VEAPPAISEMPLSCASFPQYLQFIFYFLFAFIARQQFLFSLKISFPVKNRIKNILYTFIPKIFIAPLISRMIGIDI